jgi:hypothetical protein
MYVVSWQIFQLWINQSGTNACKDLWADNETANWIFWFFFVLFTEPVFSNEALENV